MTNGLILAQCKSTWRSRLDIDYLDEKSAVKHEQMTQKGHAIGAKLRQFTDYASKENIGQVHIAGYLHSAVAVNRDGTCTHPMQLDNDERKSRIVREWSKVLKQPARGRGAKADVIQHRLVFSMSTTLHDSCVAAGLSPERVLHDSMKKVMRKFNDRFHNDDRIAYAYGFHHDTDNLHIHVALCPRTADGMYVGFSTPKNKQDNPSNHKDQLGYVRECFVAENRKWGQFLAEPEKLKQLQSKHHAEKLFFQPKRTFQHLETAAQQRDTEALLLHNKYDALKRLHRKIEKLKAEQQQTKMLGLASRFFRLSHNRVPLHAARFAQRGQLRELRDRYFRLRASYLKDHRQYTKHGRQNYGNPIAYQQFNQQDNAIHA